MTPLIPYYCLPIPINQLPSPLWMPTFGDSRAICQQVNQLVKPKLAQRVEVIPHFSKAGKQWGQWVAKVHHYMHKTVCDRAMPLAYSIHLDGQCVGMMMFSTIHFTRWKGMFGYEGLPTQWQVLCLNRLWLHPDVQNQTVIDRDGKAHRLTLASCAIAKVMKRVQRDWLVHRPPVDVNQPYHIRLIVSYSDPKAGFKGTVYKAAGFKAMGITKPHKAQTTGNRGKGTPHALHRWVMELPQPDWEYESPSEQLQLNLESALPVPTHPEESIQFMWVVKEPLIQNRRSRRWGTSSPPFFIPLFYAGRRILSLPASIH